MRTRTGRDDAGAVAVEFALVLPLLLLMLGGLTAFGLRAIYAASAEHAARRAVTEARFVDRQSLPVLEERVCTAALAGLIGPTRGTLSGSTPGSCAPGTLTVCYTARSPVNGSCRTSGVPVVGDRVSVRVELQVPFLSGLLGGQDTATASGGAVGQVER